MPSWLIVVSNIVVVGALFAVFSFFRWAGPEIAVGFLGGFFCCYTLFRCWVKDYADERRPHFTD